MRKLLTFLTILTLTLGFGQNSQTDFLRDLDFVYENLKNTTSYKTQKSKQKNVQSTYNELKNQHVDLNIIESYIKLYELVDEITDYHNEIYGNSESFSYNDLQDETFLNSIKMSADYNFYPQTQMDLDSLERELAKRKFDDYEGIYYHQHYFKIAIIKRPDNLLEGIILETKIPSWQRGETILYLLPQKDNRFRMFSGKFIDKNLLSSIDYFVNGEFKTSKWQKEKSETNYYTVDFPDQKYVIKNLNDRFTYIKLGSFSSSNEGITEATNFYNEIPEKIKTENLIVDLRNNYGGGDKSSKQFYKLFKKFKGKIYVLVNFYTVSNAEQFAVKMKKRKNVMLLGDNTRGMITYGHNYGDDKETPSQNFRIHFTDLKNNWRNYLKYEGTGLKPEVYLTSDKKWVEQIIDKYDH